MKYNVPEISIVEEDNFYNFKKWIDSEEYKNNDSKYIIPIGYNNKKNKFHFIDLSKEDIIYASGMFDIMDSVVNTMVDSLLMRNSPEDLKMDIYTGFDLLWCNILPHMIERVKMYTASQHFVYMLIKAMIELDNRKEIFDRKNVASIDEYNLKAYKKLPHVMFFMERIRFRGENITQTDIQYINGLLQRLSDAHPADYGIHVVVSFSDGYPKDNQIVEVLDKLEKCASLKIKYEAHSLGWDVFVRIQKNDTEISGLNDVRISQENSQSIINYYQHIYWQKTT